MQTDFDDTESLYRAFKPQGIYVKEDGSFSSAIFKDSHGTSVDRLGGRDEMEAARILATRRETKNIAAVTVGDCHSAETHVKQLPEDDNDYHCEIHKSPEEIVLSKKQCKKLIKCARFLEVE